MHPGVVESNRVVIIENVWRDAVEEVRGDGYIPRVIECVTFPNQVGRYTGNHEVDIVWELSLSV